MGEHIFLHHHAHQEAQIVLDLIVIVVQSVGYLNLKFSFADSIIKHDDNTVVFDGLIVNLPVFQDNCQSRFVVSPSRCPGT